MELVIKDDIVKWWEFCKNLISMITMDKKYMSIKENAKKPKFDGHSNVFMPNWLHLAIS